MWRVNTFKRIPFGFCSHYHWKVKMSHSFDCANRFHWFLLDNLVHSPSRFNRSKIISQFFLNPFRMKIFCFILIIVFAAVAASSIQLAPGKNICFLICYLFRNISIISIWKKKGNICALPTLDKTCSAPFKNWFYNSKTRKCEQHDGCGGNANRFETRSECERTCK